DGAATKEWPCSCSVSRCLFLAAVAIDAPEEGTTCLREAASAEAGEIVQLHKKRQKTPPACAKPLRRRQVRWRSYKNKNPWWVSIFSLGRRLALSQVSDRLTLVLWIE
ncbi:MAG: hypothetical protein O3A59_10290, partial [Nitrospirae bacterium]|nr:hypothetical protein [Nitrospirota bacterium]